MKGGAKLLRFYILLTLVAIGLSAVPFATGQYIGKVLLFGSMESVFGSIPFVCLMTVFVA